MSRLLAEISTADIYDGRAAQVGAAPAVPAKLGRTPRFDPGGHEASDDSSLSTLRVCIGQEKLNSSNGGGLGRGTAVHSERCRGHISGINCSETYQVAHSEDEDACSDDCAGHAWVGQMETCDVGNIPWFTTDQFAGAWCIQCRDGQLPTTDPSLPRKVRPRGGQDASNPQVDFRPRLVAELLSAWFGAGERG